jgi:hypothetical protein
VSGRSPQAGRATRPTDQAPAGLGDTASVPNADFVEHVAGAICLAIGDEAAALAAIAEVEHWLTTFLKRCARGAANSGSDFNQGVVRGLEIAAAQVEHGHYQNHPPSLASTMSAGTAETEGLGAKPASGASEAGDAQ